MNRQEYKIWTKTSSTFPKSKLDKQAYPVLDNQNRVNLKKEYFFYWKISSNDPRARYNKQILEYGSYAMLK